MGHILTIGASSTFTSTLCGIQWPLSRLRYIKISKVGNKVFFQLFKYPNVVDYVKSVWAFAAARSSKAIT